MGTRRFTVGIPQLTWLYVDVEVEDEGDHELEKENAIEQAYEEAQKHNLCVNCQVPPSGNWRRHVDDLGTLIDVKVKLELDITDR